MLHTPEWKSLHYGWRKSNNLPHFDMAGLYQSITFRLSDSLSPTRLTELRQRYPTDKQAMFVEDVETELDAHAGNCWLRDPRIAKIVEGALLHFDGERYQLIAWVIMPNHVHVVIQVLPGNPLAAILHSWKSFTAKEANKLLERTGQFWQEDYFDRVIRDEKHLHGVVDYIHYNPVKAGLCRSIEDWRWSSAWRIQRKDEPR